MMRSLFIILMFWVVPVFAQDATPSDRARDIGESLRCVVCQNQSIYESDAPLAEDMRKMVEKRLEQGDSDAEVIAYMRDKYGDYVLLKPPVQTNTYVLWVLPFLLLLAGLFWFFKTGQNRGRNENTPPDEGST